MRDRAALITNLQRAINSGSRVSLQPLGRVQRTVSISHPDGDAYSDVMTVVELRTDEDIRRLLQQAGVDATA